MTQHDSSTLPTHRPDTSSEAPETPETPEAPATPGPSRPERPWLPPLAHALGLLVVYLLALCTPIGQRAENALLNSTEGAGNAWFYPLSGAEYGSTPVPPLELSAEPTIAVGTAVLVLLILIRRCWWQGCAALGIVVCTVGVSEVFPSVLPRPDLVNARESLLDQGFPSGHAAIPAVLTLGAVLVVAPRIRPYVATAGVLWLACIAGYSATGGGHRSSEVLGAVLIACTCSALATWLLWLLPNAAAPDVTRTPRALPAVVLALSAVIAFVCGAHGDSLTRSLFSGVTGSVCAALVWYAAMALPTLPSRPSPLARTARR